MIIRKIRKIAKLQQAEKLSVAEKLAMRSALLDFVRTTPGVRNQPTGRLISLRGLINNLRETKFMPIALIIALFIAVSGGTSLAAENSVPGDLLYPVKISVNEKIRSAVNFSDESKVEWEIDKVARRLEEAEKLKVKNRLDVTISETVKNDISIQTKTASQLAEKFQDSEKSFSANSRLEAVLRGHAQILLALSEKDDGAAEIILDVLDDTKAISESRVEAEGEISAKAEADFEIAAKNKMKAAENKIAEVKKIVDKNSFLSEPVAARLSAQLNSALSVYNEGKAELDLKQYNQAFITFQEALRLAQEAQIIVHGAKQLDIDWQGKINASKNDSNRKNDQNDDAKKSQDKAVIEEKFPVHIDALIDAANRINTRTKTEIKAPDADDSDRGDAEDKDTDRERSRSEAETNAEVESDLIDIEVENELTL